MVVVVVAMVVAINIVALGFHHVPVLPVHMLILDIHGHMFVHVTSLIMCIHVLFQSVAPIFVQIAVVFSTVFVQVIIAVWLITIAIMRIAIMARFSIPMSFIPVRSIHVKVMTTINLIT